MLALRYRGVSVNRPGAAKPLSAAFPKNSPAAFASRDSEAAFWRDARRKTDKVGSRCECKISGAGSVNSGTRCPSVRACLFRGRHAGATVVLHDEDRGVLHGEARGASAEGEVQEARSQRLVLGSGLIWCVIWGKRG